MSYTVAVLIVSDRVSLGERVDGCLPVFQSILSDTAFQITNHALCSDDPDQILISLQELLQSNPNLIFTSGGTGCSIRDNTPEVSSRLIGAPTPGIDEAIRRFSSEKTPFAIYSRAVSGFAGNSLIINLPGSPKAVSEILEFLIPTLEHPLKLRAGGVTDCAEEQAP